MHNIFYHYKEYFWLTGETLHLVTDLSHRIMFVTWKDHKAMSRNNKNLSYTSRVSILDMFDKCILCSLSKTNVFYERK